MSAIIPRHQRAGFAARKIAAARVGPGPRVRDVAFVKMAPAVVQMSEPMRAVSAYPSHLRSLAMRRAMRAELAGYEGLGLSLKSVGKKLGKAVSKTVKQVASAVTAAPKAIYAVASGKAPLTLKSLSHIVTDPIRETTQVVTRTPLGVIAATALIPGAGGVLVNVAGKLLSAGGAVAKAVVGGAVKGVKGVVKGATAVKRAASAVAKKVLARGDEAETAPTRETGPEKARRESTGRLRRVAAVFGEESNGAAVVPYVQPMSYSDASIAPAPAAGELPSWAVPAAVGVGLLLLTRGK